MDNDDGDEDDDYDDDYEDDDDDDDDDDDYDDGDDEYDDDDKITQIILIKIIVIAGCKAMADRSPYKELFSFQ